MAITDDTLYRLKGSQVKDIANRILGEIDERVSGDNILQGEIDSMQLASDVTDVVGTYTDLQNYDTTELSDKDIILVLSDSTHNDAEAYYRWSESSSAFSYIGSVGPYYTKSETDNLLLGKQDVLTAGTGITITTAGGVTTISVTGGGVSAQTIFYANLSETGSTRYIYKDAAFATKASAQDIINANNDGQVILRGTTTANPTAYNDAYLQNAFIMPHNSYYEFVFLDIGTRYEYSVSNVTDDAFYYDTSEIQSKLTAGSNITITGSTISATDTTYSAFTGATAGDAGTSGLVPAPAAGDQDKVLTGGATYLGVDTTVTQSSSNLVTSGAVYTVVGDVESLLNAI